MHLARPVEPSKPSLLLSAGAGRVALGNDIPAVFSNNMTSLQVIYGVCKTPCSPRISIAVTHSTACRTSFLTVFTLVPYPQRLWHLSSAHSDLIWMMPLHEPMRPMIKSQIADLVNAADGSVPAFVFASIARI